MRGAPPEPTRRALLAGLVGSVASAALGCGARVEPKAKPPEPEGPPPLEVPSLLGLLPLAGLRWLVLAKPRAIASTPWLIPPIGVVVPEARFDAFAKANGLDLRQVLDVAVASYDDVSPEAPPPEPGASGAKAAATLYLARHATDGLAIERLFRARLTGSEQRVVTRPDVVRVSGTAGTRGLALGVLGHEVVAFQEGGHLTRGPVRIAELYALGKLKRAPTALAKDPLKAMEARFGPSPLAKAFALGPFEGELARGARGLLAGAVALGAAVRPTAREHLGLAIAVAGDFSATGPKAAEELLAAWRDLAEGSFGRLLGLDRPVEKPLATHASEAVSVAVELDAQRLAEGLATATGERLEALFR